MQHLRTLRDTLAAAALFITAAFAAQAQVGVERASWNVASGSSSGSASSSASGSASSSAAAISGVVFYPTAAAATAQRFGPFEVVAAPGARPTAGRHPLVLISHGTGGHELGHVWLAQRLAAEGYVVVALRHPGDNFEDRSGVGRRDYFAERPRQVSRVLDRLLAEPRWAELIDAGRIAAIGHSAGGYTVLALAGGRPDTGRLARHCGAGGVGLREDAVMCGLGGFSVDRPASMPTEAPAQLPDLRDPRIRAVVLAAPLGIAVDPASLATLSVPVLIEYGGADDVLNPKFHAEPLCAAIPRVRCVRTAAAGHFTLFQTATGPLGPPAIDPARDPAGFDRAAWQAEVWPRLRDFLAQSLR